MIMFRLIFILISIITVNSLCPNTMFQFLNPIIQKAGFENNTLCYPENRGLLNSLNEISSGVLSSLYYTGYSSDNNVIMFGTFIDNKNAYLEHWMAISYEDKNMTDYTCFWVAGVNIAAGHVGTGSSTVWVSSNLTNTEMMVLIHRMNLEKIGDYATNLILGNLPGKKVVV